MKNPSANRELWFITGSQHLYGRETLNQVEKNSRLVTGRTGQSVAVEFEIPASCYGY